MKKPTIKFGFEDAETVGFRAIRQRKEAEKAIVRVAVELERAAPGPTRLALWEPLMEAVRAYNQAEVDFQAAQVDLGVRTKP